MSSRKDVEFSSADGLMLRGWLYSAGVKRPTILMSNGFSGSKEAYLDDFAKRFQAAGYTAIAYDNRNWFESEGVPRNEVDPLLQTRDFTAAFHFAASLQDVDATNIILWGSSLAGGNAICAAAINKQVRAVICQVPFVSGEIIAQSLGSKADFVLADRAHVASGGSSQMIPIIPESIDEVESGASQAILACSDIFPFLAELDRRGIRWEKYTTAQSLFYLQSHDPRSFIHRLSPMPMLMIVAGRDKCISPNSQIDMFARALEPKKLHVLRDAGHFDVYHGPAFEENINEQLKFLEEIL